MKTLFLINILLIMKTEKMSIANIQGKLSRTEMKKIMAGSGSSDCSASSCSPACAPGYSCGKDYDRGGCMCKPNND